MFPALSGCSGVSSNFRRIERLLVVQTLGFDRKNGSVLLSLASAADAKAPRRLSATGASITSAMDRAYNYSYEEELFSYHVDNVLIGEKAAEEGIEDLLDYICQSPTMRIDVPLFIVRGATAEEAVMGVGEEDEGVSEVMSGVRERLSRRGCGKVFSTADVIRNTSRNGSALICALDCSKSTESLSSDAESSGLSAAVFGYAVIRDNKLCGFIEPEDMTAAGLLINDASVSTVQVRDKHGQLAVLEVDGGSSEVKPVWAAPGVLEGLDIRVDVRGSVLEVSGRSELSSAEYVDHLTAQLEKAISARVSAVLQRSQSLRADFLGLGERVEQASPESFRLMSQAFYDALPALRLTVTVSGELGHTNDMKDE